MTPPQPPSALLAGQGGGTSFYENLQRIQPIAPQPAKQPPQRPAPPPEPAWLSLGDDGRCTLSKALIRAAHIKPGSYVRLVAPVQRGGQWYLDTSPKEGDGRQLTADSNADVFRFRNPQVGRLHFTKSLSTRRGRSEQIAGSVVVSLTKLSFLLGQEHPSHPGYYLLLPAPGLRVGRYPG